jgi:MoxR-like ATPase
MENNTMDTTQDNHNPMLNTNSRVNLEPILDIADRIRAATGSIIVGQYQSIELLLVALLAEGHVLIEGVPGVAKTLMAKTIAKLIDADFSRIQFTPDLMPSDVIGTSIFNPQESKFSFRAGPIFSNMVLIDEINRAPAKTQAALFEVMEERQVTVDGFTHIMPPPFMIIATQNPVEHEGTYRLPEAQLDRFLFKINIDYPNLDEETLILKEHHEQKGKNLLSQLEAVISKEELARCKTLVQKVHIEEKLLAYIAQIIVATRSDKSLYLGASPRASIALLNASKALAVIRGRDFVTPEDVLHIVPAVLRHRIALMPEKEMEGILPDDIIKTIAQQIEIPR